LGYDEPIPDDEERLTPGVRYRAQGNLWLAVEEYETHVSDQVESRVRNQISKTERADKKRWANNHLEDVPVTYGRARLYIKPDSTEKLKDLQSELGIPEEAVREKMDDDWQRLTAKRRKKILGRIIKEQINESVNSPDSEAIRAEIRAEVEERYEQTRPVNLQYGNHLVIIENGVQERRRGDIQVIVPEQTRLYLIHDEHQVIERQLEPCRIRFGMLDRHQQA
jgi:hypothetical protein